MTIMIGLIDMELSRHDKVLLSELIGDASTLIAGAFKTDILRVKNFLNKLMELVKRINEENGNIVFGFELHEKLDSDMELVAEDIMHCRQSGRECIKIDLQNNFLPISDILVADLDKISNFSADNERIFIRVEGTVIQTIINGVIRKKVDVLAPGAREPRLTKYGRSGSSYALLIKDHHKIQLPKEMEFFWNDRRKRVLIAERQTEKILQNSLFRWIEQNLIDGRVRTEVHSISQERTDIEIQTFQGEVFVIEIKWLGVNAAKTKFDEQRIKEGMDQIFVYLGRDPLATRGVLVCYDGRHEREHSTNSVIDEKSKHMKGDYYVLFLPSETASEIRR
ncbi:hypothetical protein [Paenibacillus sp. PAMC 26794]|uniref:hypothetical protein n=1 Tax=Paenibacillus sp. PAMC 26794 TaxID=1257080 RepID=UPI00037B0EBB|nr:hypothetical protein [Paenibacillus sp. PAMC 26794]